MFNTSDTPAERETAAFGAPLESIWKRCIFDLCGVKRVERRMFGVVVTSTLEQRQAWLAEVERLCTDLFPA